LISKVGDTGNLRNVLSQRSAERQFVINANFRSSQLKHSWIDASETNIGTMFGWLSLDWQLSSARRHYPRTTPEANAYAIKSNST